MKYKPALVVTTKTAVEDTVDAEARIKIAAGVEGTKVEEGIVTHVVKTSKDAHMVTDTVGDTGILHIQVPNVKLQVFLVIRPHPPLRYAAGSTHNFE